MYKILHLSVLIAVVSGSVEPYDHASDVGLNIVELATKYGYPIESHEVQTEDGYLLTLHRIPHAANGTAATRPPILLMHGLLSSAADWINMGPGVAFGLLLADQGYDVWMGNARGTTWSRKHIELDPDEDAAAFYDFSWHEIGYYDLPAKIDFILETTGEEKVFYVGHSQGTTSFFAMASARPEYNDKIRLMSAFAPVAYMDNFPNPILNLIVEKDYDEVFRLVEILNIHEFLPHFDFITSAGGGFCGNPKFQPACVGFLNVFCGESFQMDPNMFAVISSNAPAGISIKQILHYAQEIKGKYFGQYDLGTENNTAKYQQSSPPLYDTTKITAPVSLHYSDNDLFTAIVDVEKLAGEIPNLVTLRKVPLKEFNHCDFIWSENVVELLYNDVFAELNSY